MELLSPKEVAANLKVTENTVREMLKNGRLKGYKVGKLWRIDKTEIKKLIEIGGENAKK